MQTQTMTITELTTWAALDSRGDAPAVAGLLNDYGFADTDAGGLVRGLDGDTPVVVSWPDHVRFPSPNSDIGAIRLA
jgi:hypothetical protein